MSLEYQQKSFGKKRNVEIEVWGDEPEIEELVDLNSIETAKIYNWYNYFYGNDDARSWVQKYMKNNGYSQEDLHIYSKSPYLESSIVKPVYARLINRGVKIPQECVTELSNYIKRHIDHVRNAERLTKESERKPTAKSRKLDDAICAIDNCIDVFVFSNYNCAPSFSFFQTLKEFNLKANHVAELKAHYNDYYNQITNIDSDPQLIEAYLHLKSQQKNNYIKFIKGLFEDFDRLLLDESVIKVRKPRKKKAPNLLQIVKNVKYMKEDKSLNLVSVKPESIIGALQCWLYSTKYKILRKLETSETKGLNIRGTSVVDFDPKLSRSKSVRKPEIVLKDVLTSNKVRLRKIFEEFKGSDSPINGRLNDDTIILRIAK
jgi:hypothetical protein